MTTMIETSALDKALRTAPGLPGAPGLSHRGDHVR